MKIIKRTAKYALTFALSALLLMPACGKKFETGFGGQINADAVSCAARSDYNSFDTDDVTLEFFYGGSIEEYAADDGRTSLGIALYFCDEAGYGAVKNDFAYADYLSLESMSCAKFIPAEEFNSDKYAVEVTPFKKSFAHGEKMTVPEELFDEQRGSFALAFFAIYRLEGQQDFFVGYRNCLTIDYELSDDGRVRLLQADASFL